METIRSGEAPSNGRDLKNPILEKRKAAGEGGREKKNFRGAGSRRPPNHLPSSTRQGQRGRKDRPKYEGATQKKKREKNGTEVRQTARRVKKDKPTIDTIRALTQRETRTKPTKCQPRRGKKGQPLRRITPKTSNRIAERGAHGPSVSVRTGSRREKNHLQK